MNVSVRTIDTPKYTYHIIKSAKTTYEQDQERQAELKYMMIQKSVGILFIVFCLIMAYISKEGYAIIFAAIVGLPLLISKQHILTI